MKRQYICAGEEFCTIGRHVPAPLFKRDFEVDYGNHKSYRLEITVAGFYRLFINGTEITKGFFAPYISNPDHYIYYDVYDIAKFLNARKAEIKVLLGNGFCNSNDFGIWDFENASYRSAPYFALELYEDDELILNSDEKFLVTDSKITFDDLRCGEHFDNRITEKYRNVVFRQAPKAERRKCEIEPIVIAGTIAPEKITKNNKGYIYDFGTNNSGVCRLRIKGRAGQKITLSHGEILQGDEIDLSNITISGRNKSGYVQQDTYIATDGYQEYIPSFTYHGFRYVFVEGIDDSQATEELLTYLVLHSDIKKSGAFICSDPMINEIQQCVRRSDLSNFYYFPTDCPQREKNGWTADISLSAEQLLYNFDCGNSLREWLFNLRKAQRKNGQLPGICPTATWGYDWGNGPAWDSVLVELVYELYRFTGDKSIITENKEAILLYFEYLETRRSKNGLFSFGLGDWCEAGQPSEDIYSTDIEVTDSIMCMEMALKSAFLMDVTGDLKRAEYFRKFAMKLKNDFRSAYIRNGRSETETQTALALEITHDIFNGNEIDGAYGQLREAMAKADYHIKTGVIGAKYLFAALSEGNFGDIALNAITRRDFPGYGYNVCHGGTTLWECFNEYVEDGEYIRRKDGGRLLSFNHHFWGSVSAWFYRFIAGINIISKDEAEISPDFTLPLDSATGEFSYKGRYIRVNWEKNDNEVRLELSDTGYTGRVFLKRYLMNGKHQFDIKEGVNTYFLLSEQ